jgi:hypothetical protein
MTVDDRDRGVDGMCVSAADRVLSQNIADAIGA